MNAVSQAITPELASKIAYLAVLFRAEFCDARVDLSPWLTDTETQRQLDLHSIDLSFHFLTGNLGLACDCVLMQIHFSEGLLKPTCQLLAVETHGYRRTQQQWQFSTASRGFEGKYLPEQEYQARFRKLVHQIVKLFEFPNQVRTPSDHR